MGPSPPPLEHFALVLFPGFQALDAFGPLDILNLLSTSHPSMTLTLLAETLDPVPVKHPSDRSLNPSFSQSVVPTMTFASALPSLHGSGLHCDVLLVPGGVGTRAPGGNINATIAFVRAFAPRTKHIISVCTGAHVLAQAGLLDGKRATTNKMRFSLVKELNPGVEWVERARWVRAGEVWTSAGISAGMDVTLAFVGEHWGVGLARGLAKALEYSWREVQGGEDDPFYDAYFAGRD